MTGETETRGRLALYGAGGHGKVVAHVARAAGWEVVAWVDDGVARAEGAGAPRAPDPREPLTWAAFEARRRELGVRHVALAIGDNASRERVHARVVAAGLRVVSLVHPSAVVAPDAVVGEGAVVMPGAILNPDCAVGPGAIVNSGAVVEHDCRVGPYAHLSPNAALGGGATVGARTHVGLGAAVLPGVAVGADVRVGAGAVVHRDVEDGLTVAGVPARPLPRAPGEPRT